MKSLFFTIFFTIFFTMFFTIFFLQSGIISGWGYTEVTKILKPRPLTSDVLREAEIYILPQANIYLVGYNGDLLYHHNGDLAL